MDVRHRRWSAPAQPSNVRELRSAAGEFAADAGFAGSELHDIRACVSEAVTNSIVHAFRDGRPPGTITLSAELREEEVVFLVDDDGMGFQPRADSPGLGLGIPTIAAMADSMSINASRAGGTVVCMAFKLHAG